MTVLIERSVNEKLSRELFTTSYSFNYAIAIYLTLEYSSEKRW